VNSGRNQDLGREGLTTVEKLGNLRSWAPRPRRRVPAAPDRRSRKPLLIQIEWPTLPLSYARRLGPKPVLGARSPASAQVSSVPRCQANASPASPDSWVAFI
jgi:hypothetical protein